MGTVHITVIMSGIYTVILGAGVGIGNRYICYSLIGGHGRGVKETILYLPVEVNRGLK